MNKVHWWLSAIFILAFAGWMANLSFGISGISEGNSNSVGQLGDVFGIANSAFSGLAFIGVFYSIMLQRKELDTVREERDETRSILQDQQENLKHQRFETTFYQLLDAFNRIADAIEVTETQNSATGRTKTVKGRDAIEIIREDFDKKYYTSSKNHSPTQTASDAKKASFHNRILLSAENRLEIIQRVQKDFDTAYHDWFDKYGDDLGRYFRSLYTVLNFVEIALGSTEKSNNVDENYWALERKFYFKLLRAQLSQDEADLIVINYLSRNTTSRFNFLLEKYGMAKNADLSRWIIHSFEHKIDDRLFGRSYMNWKKLEEERQEAESIPLDDPADDPSQY